MRNSTPPSFDRFSNNFTKTSCRKLEKKEYNAPTTYQADCLLRNADVKTGRVSRALAYYELAPPDQQL